MMGHNIRFKGLIWKIIPKLFLLPLFEALLVHFGETAGGVRKEMEEGN